MSGFGGQRYTRVPGMGLTSTTEGSGGDDMIQYRGSSFAGTGLDSSFSDSRYPTPQRLSTSTFASPSSRPDSLGEYPFPSALPASSGPAPSRPESAMPLITELPSRSQTFSSGYAHQNIPSEQYYPMSTPADTAADYAALASAQKARKRKRGWMIGGAVLAILAIIGIIVGVVVSQVHSNDSNNDSTTSTSNSTTLTDSSDPSDFTKDSNYHQSFWGFAYTPNLAQLPWCGVTQTNVTRDIQLLSQLTTRLRLYGANCNQTAMVMQAIQDTKVNMTVWLGIYVDSNETAYDDQLSAVSSVLTTYGTDHISGITVGNEYILDTAGTDSLTDSTYLAAVKTITDKVAEVNTTVQALGLSKTLPIGTSDAGSIMSKTLGEGVDYFMANVHPWFGSVAIDDAAVWTYEFFQEYDVEVAAEASNNPTTYIAETGWPTQSMNSSDTNDGAGGSQGEASVANLQTFLDTFVCQANANGTQYFYFEAFDEPWKEEYGGVEPYWGLFDSDRNLKNVTIPVCS